MFSSPLRRAITRGLKPDGDLVAALSDLDDYPIRSKKDAKAICDALSTLPSANASSKSHFSSPLYALTSLFQDVDGRDAPAHEVLYREGLPHLIRIYDVLIEKGNDEDDDDLLFVLKILAMYGSREGAERIVEAARRPLNPDGYMWHVVFSILSEGHPQRQFIFRELSVPIPSGFIAIGLLDSANAAAIEGDLEQHPFASEAGSKMLRTWLEDKDPDNSSYAHSATAALPFISNPARDELIALAMDHADQGVQMEAAWAAGKLGRESGLKVLARFCLDVNHSDVAKRYLTELDREEMIPAESTDSSFQAKAAFARWLAHPNELGRAPDELTILDHRQLAWPPEQQSQPFWLLRYRLRDETGLEDDDVGCGLVGSITWSFFSYRLHERPPEDAYAIHCYWEMENAELIDENEVVDGSEYASMLNQWKGDPLDAVNITHVSEVSPKLNIPSRFLACATAKRNGQNGWVVLDGPRSAWYPESEQPAETGESTILRIHVGRQLLGFQDQPDRKKYLVTEASDRTPHDYINAYEKLLTEASESGAKRQEELLGNHSLLARHFDKYVDAIVKVNGGDREEAVLLVYERFLKLAAGADEAIRESVYDSFGVLGESFDDYVDALVSRGRAAEVPALINTFAPRWDHNLGYGKLGSAAYKAGQVEVAEQWILKLKSGLDDYCRCEEMSMLARIWTDRGDNQAAKDLLVDCLQKIVVEIKQSEYNSDREMFADEFRHHRSTYLDLFPEGETELSARGIPVDPL